MKQAEEKDKKKAEKEARIKAKREAEEAKKAKQAEEKAKKEAEKEARIRAEREAEEAKKAKQAEEKAKKEAEKEARIPEIYEGTVSITIMSPINIDEIRKLEQCIQQAENMSLVLVGGSINEGTYIVIELEKPIPLLDALKEMPPVEEAFSKDKKITVRLRT